VKGAGIFEYGVKGRKTRSTTIERDPENQERDEDAAHPKTICPLIGRGGGEVAGHPLFFHRGLLPGRRVHNPPFLHRKPEEGPVSYRCGMEASHVRCHSPEPARILYRSRYMNLSVRISTA
jgi:hypothetical protein